MSLTSKFASVALALALLCAVSCNGNTTAPAETTVGEVASTSRIETTVTTAAETTETVTTAETAAPASAFSEFDINSEECLMYRLLDMTVDEIEAEFGEMTLYGIIAGGTPCYQLTELGILFYFSDYPDVHSAPLPRDMVPVFIETRGYNGIVYPGIYEGMDSKELIDMIGIEELDYSISEIRGGFVSEHNVNGRAINIRWELPEEDTEEYINEYYKGISDGNREQRRPMLDDIAAKMKTGEVKGKVLHIIM